MRMLIMLAIVRQLTPSCDDSPVQGLHTNNRGKDRKNLGFRFKLLASVSSSITLRTLTCEPFRIHLIAKCGPYGKNEDVRRGDRERRS